MSHPARRASGHTDLPIEGARRTRRLDRTAGQAIKTDGARDLVRRGGSGGTEEANGTAVTQTGGQVDGIRSRRTIRASRQGRLPGDDTVFANGTGRGIDIVGGAIVRRRAHGANRLPGPDIEKPRGARLARRGSRLTHQIVEGADGTQDADSQASGSVVPAHRALHALRLRGGSVDGTHRTRDSSVNTSGTVHTS
jgi:hypothetical protein